MRSRSDRAVAAVLTAIAAAALCVFAGSAPARADVEPTAPSPDPITAPDAIPAPGAIAGPAAPATPLAAATATPGPAPAALDLAPAMPPQPPSRPFYRRHWFWGAVGLVVITAAIIIVASASSSSGPATPDTAFGGMRAF